MLALAVNIHSMKSHRENDPAGKFQNSHLKLLSYTLLWNTDHEIKAYATINNSRLDWKGTVCPGSIYAGTTQ